MNQTGEQRERWRRLSDAVKARLDYRSFYARFCRLPERSGARTRTHCPIPNHAHSGGGKPSLSIDLQSGLFHCFSRDEGGDAISFYALLHNLTAGQALARLARELGVETKNVETESDGAGVDARTKGERESLVTRAAPDTTDALLAEDEPAEPLEERRLSLICESFLDACRREEQLEGIAYLRRRGIDRETMRRAGVVYFPRQSYRRVMRELQRQFTNQELMRSGLFNSQGHLTFYRHRLLFPFYKEGRVVYLQARTTASGVEPRWHNMRGSVPALYNIDALGELPSDTIVYLVEGFTDTLTLLANGYAAVGLVGAGGLKEDWLPPLARFRVVAALDPDAAGASATDAYTEIFARRGMRLARLSLASDVNDFFRQHAADSSARFASLTELALAKLPHRDERE